MSEYNVESYNNINFDRLILEDTKYNEIDNIYESNISYDEKPLIIITPKMILNDMEYTSGKLSNLIFEFPDSSDEFYKFLLDLDKVLKNKIITGSEQMTGDTIPKNNIDELYKSNLELPKTLLSSPMLNITIYSNDLEDDKIYIYNKNEDRLDIDSVMISGESSMLLKIVKIKFYRRKINLVISLHSIKISNQVPQLNGFMFNDSESDSDVDETEI
jgi:hypothetical protein